MSYSLFIIAFVTVTSLGFVETFDYKDEIAQGTCTSLTSEADHVYAVKRECTSNGLVTCSAVCTNIGKNCFNALHVYNGRALAPDVTGQIGLHTYRYDSCSGTGCGPNFCCCSDKNHTIASVYPYKDQIAQSTCTSILSGAGNHVYAVKRECTSAAPVCHTVCSTLGKTCFNALHVYNSVNLANTDYGKVGLHTYKYNSCSSSGCGPNFCCCYG